MTGKRWKLRLAWRASGSLAALATTAGILAATAAAAVPVNTSAPTVSGTVRQGVTLTASNGAWSNDPTSFSHRWQRCGADGTGCENIAGATSKTYRLRAADVDRTVRVGVTASNADGQATAFSGVTEVVSANTPPVNSAKPSITGLAEPGDELLADPGKWTGGVRSFAFQWRTCDASGENCTDVAGATGTTYGVRRVDVGRTIRLAVTATNLTGSTSATSDPTGLVRTPAAPPPPPPPRANKAPTIRFISTRFVGARIYVRMRVCDDSRKNVNIIARDSKRHVRSYTRRYATLAPPRPCAALTRNWLPAPRFRHGRYVVTLWARDKSGKTSLPARRTFFR